jgi:hypothetical protein
MQPFRGSTGAYTKDIQSFYLKYTFNVYSIYSNEKSIIPYQLIDSTNSKTSATSVGAVDLGVLPGFAYVKRFNDFQIGAMGGFGVVVQSKFYKYDNSFRNFIGLAPRYDLKLIAGYNKPKYYVMLVTDFDNKSFRFNDLIFRQTYYSMRLVGGIRLGIDRDKIRSILAENGIPSKIYYPIELHKQKAFEIYHKEGESFPVSAELCQTVLSLPMHTELSKETVSFIARHVLESVDSLRA